jgi:hypothetical protein
MTASMEEVRCTICMWAKSLALATSATFLQAMFRLRIQAVIRKVRDVVDATG